MTVDEINTRRVRNTQQKRDKGQVETIKERDARRINDAIHKRDHRNMEALEEALVMGGRM